MSKREAKVVIKLGQVTQQYAKLVQECRGYFEPGVTRHLKEGSQWKIKDYVPLGKDFRASHIVAFSQSEEFNNLKIASLSEKGKTFYFKVDKYLLSGALKKGHVSPIDNANGYFIVGLGIEETDPLHELIQELKDNIKPTHETTRVLMFKKISAHQYLLSHYLIRKEEKKGQANLIKLVLVEVGPRIELRLQKIEEGICTGNVVYHTYIQKTPAELADRRQRLQARERERQRRRAEQEENVRRKKRPRTESASEGGDDDQSEGSQDTQATHLSSDD